MNVVDFMLEARERALAAGRTPRRWEMSDGAYFEIVRRADEARRTQAVDTAAPSPTEFMGIPISRTRGEGSKCDLIVDELP